MGKNSYTENEVNKILEIEREYLTLLFDMPMSSKEFLPKLYEIMKKRNIGKYKSFFTSANYVKNYVKYYNKEFINIVKKYFEEIF